MQWYFKAAAGQLEPFVLVVEGSVDNEGGLTTVTLLDYDGGEILRRGLADFPVVVRCDYIPRI